MNFLYEYPEDRFVFRCWCESGWHGNKMPYWSFNEYGVLTLELRKGEKRVTCQLSTKRLDLCRKGWRWLVAQSLRQMRFELRRHDMLRCSVPQAYCHAYSAAGHQEQRRDRCSSCTHGPLLAHASSSLME